MLNQRLNLPPLPVTPPSEMRVQLIAADRPLALFPVRLETRFFPQADGGFELRVRVYPDKVHLDSHEPELTAQEKIWGEHFWEQIWRAGNDEEARKRAWRQLADRFDPQRSAWISRALKPLNPEDRPATPVAADQPLPTPIRFPAPSLRADAESWSRAPLARMLPDRWVVIAYSSGRLAAVVFGSDIPDPLPAGPDPKANVAATDEQLAIDNGMKWIVDFNAAEKVGMGVRLKLTREVAQAGLEVLFVMGVKATLNSVDSAKRITELFNAHHYTDGLSFVLNGTPSNNTPSAPSGFSSHDPGYQESYQSELTAGPFKPGDGSNADEVTKALGLPRNIALPALGNLLNAAAKEQRDAEMMNTALWAASWGYYLQNLIGPHLAGDGTGPDNDDIAWARNHFIKYVRANGPLPTLRIGKQPYGILPVTSLDAWTPKAGEEMQAARDLWLKTLLVNLRDRAWRPNLAEVPRLGRVADPAQSDPDRDLTDIMRTDGLSHSYVARAALGRHFLQHLWSYLGFDLEALKWWARQEGLTGAILKTLELNWKSRLMRVVYAQQVSSLNLPLIQAGEISETSPLTPNYIDLLLGAQGLDAIRDETAKPASLLHALLRHAMLQEYANAAARILFANGTPLPILFKDQELIDISATSIATPTSRWQLNQKIPAITGANTLGERLIKLASFQDPNVAPVGEFRASLAHLKTLSAGRLERLFVGALDLCSHRLDAWVTSFAVKRLDAMRRTNPAGVYFGGYGWVENLKPAPARTVVAAPPGEQAPIHQTLDDLGFIHAPSLTQAATVALLRNGHLTHSTAAARDLLAIDLSSERVRLAKWLLDGVRQGQPLGALLGYRFERRLHEMKMDCFIKPFRELAPLVAKKLETSQPDAPLEAIAANNVVDGLRLHHLWKANGARMMASHPLPQPQMGAIFQAVAAELNALGEAVDAVSDAVVAESVYQVVRGNTARAAGVLDAIAGGETPPPELEIVRTPRSGVALTHRLVTLFSGAPPPPPGWMNPAASPRAAAEPHLNAWAARLLGSSANVRCVVERLGPGTTTGAETKEIRISELRLSPLDFIYAVAGGSAEEQSEIEQRILCTIVRKPDGFPADAVLRINPGRQPNWKPNELSYGEFAELVRTARKLITGARAIDNSDLDLPERAQNITVDLAELETRAIKSEQAIKEAHAVLDRLLKTPATATAEALREAILRAANFGIPGAIPLSFASEAAADRDALLVQASSIAKEAARRVNQLTTLKTTLSPSAMLEENINYQQERLRIVFGKAFVALPRFAAGNAAELEQAFADSVKLQDNDPLAAVTWFQRAARVRDGVAKLDAALRYAEVLSAGESLKLTLGQLPYQPNDRWVGLPLKSGRQIPGGRLSLVVQSSAKIDVRQPLAGLLIDEWVEIVPNASETTGVVFQYNPPDACAPQAILLAVPPTPDQAWTVGTLQRVLMETLDLAKLRVIDPEALDGVGHYLPALYLAFNANGDTVSTDFTKLTT
jgi:hypothetical protein